MKKLIYLIKNYFYYYKYWVIAGIFVVITAGFLIWSLSGRESYDYNVCLCLNDNAPLSLTDAVGKAIAENGEDVNGDGKVSVNVIDLSHKLSAARDGDALSKETRLANEIAEKSNYIFIYDDDYYKNYSFDKVFEQNPLLGEKGGTAAVLSELPAGKSIISAAKSAGIREELIPEMFISMRLSPEAQDKHIADYNRDKSCLRALSRAAQSKADPPSANGRKDLINWYRKSTAWAFGESKHTTSRSKQA